jgi:hypothetical protein
VRIVELFKNLIYFFLFCRRGAGGISSLSSTRLGGSKRGSIPTDDAQTLNNTTDDSMDNDDMPPS